MTRSRIMVFLFIFSHSWWAPWSKAGYSFRPSKLAQDVAGLQQRASVRCLNSVMSVFTIENEWSANDTESLHRILQSSMTSWYAGSEAPIDLVIRQLINSCRERTQAALNLYVSYTNQEYILHDDMGRNWDINREINHIFEHACEPAGQACSCAGLSPSMAHAQDLFPREGFRERFVNVLLEPFAFEKYPYTYNSNTFVL